MSKELKQQVIDRIRSDMKDPDKWNSLSDIVTNKINLYEEYGLAHCKDELADQDFGVIEDYYNKHGENVPDGLEDLSDDDKIDLCNNVMYELLGYGE